MVFKDEVASRMPGPRPAKASVAASAERARLLEDARGLARWKLWGPYLSERQWGTVREDYSPNGNAWDYFTHHQAPSRAYRWGEDGIAGTSDTSQRLCLALNSKARAAGASAREQALIEALATRYSTDPDADPAALAGAYADAMAAARAQFPDDQDIAVLFADALMNTSPWDYWELDGRTLKGRLGEAAAALEGVLAANPDHPGAIHMYIHLTEASATPEKAEPYADRLAALMPAAGHIVHMPSHTYYRVGRYLDSLKTNLKAVGADEAYLAQVQAGGAPSPTATTRTTSTSSWSPPRWRATPSTCCGQLSGSRARSPTTSRGRSAGSR